MPSFLSWRALASSLEELLAKQVNDELQLEYWEVFSRLDTCFEEIAGGGHERLERSRLPD